MPFTNAFEVPDPGFPCMTLAKAPVPGSLVAKFEKFSDTSKAAVPGSFGSKFGKQTVMSKAPVPGSFGTKLD